MELGVPYLGGELTIAQRRTLASSVSSLRQLWREDRMHGRATLHVHCEYLNARLHALEPLLEPWRLACAVSKSAGDRDPAVHGPEPRTRARVAQTAHACARAWPPPRVRSAHP